MAIQVVYLDPEDDIVSIRDRLKWVRESQIALVLPPKSNLLTDYLDLALLRRQTDDLRLEVGLVTVDDRVVGQAKALGFPVFPSVESTLKSRRRWWRGRRRREQVGTPTRMDQEDSREVRRRKTPRARWQVWLLRYGAVLFYIATLAILFVAAVYAIPGATVTLRPIVETVEVRRQIVADPELESTVVGGASVPGRVLSSVQEWQAEVATTGVIEVDDGPARGQVVFVNHLDQPVTVPAGTRVSTSAASRIVFQTLAQIEVPGVVGASAAADVVAVDPGPVGNVNANLINRIQGPLALQLEVRNLEALAGGGARQEPSVSEADRERLRSQIMQQLQVRALAEMEGQLSGREFLAKDSLRLVRILHETYSAFPGEQADSLALEIRAELQATAVDEAQATALVYEALTDAVGTGFALVPESLDFRSGRIQGVDNQGRVIFDMMGAGQMAAELDLGQLLNQVAGQESSIAATYLFERLPLQEYPEVDVWPSWFGRIPYLPIRIQTQIETSA
ncbi:MAG: baseplate J/gp47 family protein [Chloroflexota bacterium]|nr:MAG: baseplate J/gp47 family protein [Chloroflexota bacterium]